MSRLFPTAIISMLCLLRMGAVTKHLSADNAASANEEEHTADASVVVALPKPVPVALTSPGGNRAILTSLLLGALAAANPPLTHTLLLTNPYLAAHFLPPLPSRSPSTSPIYGYSAIDPFQDSSAFGSSYKRELRQ